MTVSAQLSVYPLRQAHLSPAINAVLQQLEAHGLLPEVGAMSTQVAGEAEVVFAALRDAFIRIASDGSVAMTITVSNACPI
jgi:uncharacterized protein YqgV (UPF0045/DUF77 family)